MRFARSPHLRLLRTLMIGMLMLAIVAKPLLAELCDMHALTHVVSAASHSAQRADTPAEARSDRDHASGAHQLLHAFEASVAFVEPFPVLTVAPARFAHLAPRSYEALAPPARAFDSPFRPPIA